MSKHGVDGVYDSDPRTNPDAKRYDRLSFHRGAPPGLKVVDAAAFSLCMENKPPMVVFGMDGEGDITRALRGTGSARWSRRADPRAPAGLRDWHLTRDKAEVTGDRTGATKET